MKIKKETFRQLIREFKLKELFIELGWNNYNTKQPAITVKETSYIIEPISEKQGFVVLLCHPDAMGKIPPYSVRKQIENRIAKHHHEHLIIFCNEQKKQHIWQLTIREEGKPTVTRETKHYSHQEPELLYQKISGLFITWEEEDSISIIDVKKRVKDTFKNSEKVTKKFYQEFKKNHTTFIGFIDGITEKVDKEWYTSLMLNRLMFIYFIQKKGFLDDNRNYLADKLTQTKELRGEDEFYSFYRDFLRVLFHDGLNKKVSDRDANIINEIGKVPYLNGGLFDVHELETKYPDIKIKDDAFENLFAFFDQYEWHLDTRQEANGKEVNPDVIGYIFEKYINDRAAMGAYYTKEDITEYIGKNTIIPFIFDEVKRHYPKAFKPDEYIWQMLALSSDKYIYDAVKFGVPAEGDIFSDLPDEIKNGFRPDIENKIVTEKDETHLWEIRKVWNKKAPEEIALPTEIYRELIQRRKRYAEVKAKIENGEITQINDFITYNLNVRQFIQDIIADAEDPFLIKHFYDAIKKVTILDPTCGSGAFLFAALNILEPLYEGCISRMQQFTEENPDKFKKFEEILADVNSPKHPNLQYFIYKSIILNNLFGVDIMNEAVEIAKLRLFLKLVSTADVDYKQENYGLEPLPDIDFNIRCGNTLVGFTKLEEIVDYLNKKGEETIIFDDEYDKINAITDKADIVAKLYKEFRVKQTACDAGSDEYHQTKIEVTKRLNELNEELNQYLAFIYGIDAELKPKQYNKWKLSHQPFHWFSEFYEIMSSGGFDVIIGNPPYVEYSKVRSLYKINEYRLEETGNMYSICTERFIQLSDHNSGLGVIIPISSISTPRMKAMIDLFQESMNNLFVSSYAVRPAKLFFGVDMNLTIFVGNKIGNLRITYSTNYIRWHEVNRSNIFNCISYAICDKKLIGLLPKSNSTISNDVTEKATSFSTTFEILQFTLNPEKDKVYYHSGGRYFRKCLNRKLSNEYKALNVPTFSKNATICLLSSSLYYNLWIMISDTFHVTKTYLNFLTFPDSLFEDSIINILCVKLLDELWKFAEYRERKRADNSVNREVNFKVGKSKPIIDEIDTVLAVHYGFTEEELDFIINYDIKYRMGKELEAYVNGEL